MGLLTLKKKNPAAALIDESPGETPRYTAFDLPGATSFDLIQQGSETIPAAGGKANPLALINADLALGFIVHEELNVTYSIPTGSAATTYANADPDAPYTHLQNIAARFGGKNGDVDISGRGLRLWINEAYPAFQDDVTSVVLPGANSSGATVTDMQTHHILWFVPFAALLDWPEGMVNLANKGVLVNLNTTWASWVSMLDLPAGATATVNSDVFTVTLAGQAVPELQAAMPYHLLGYAHTLTEYSKAADKSQVRLNLAQGIDGDIMRVGMYVVLPSGVRDAANTAGLQSVERKSNGTDVGIDADVYVMTYLRNMRAKRLAGSAPAAETGVAATGYDGIIWLPLDIGGGRNWIPAAELADLRVQANFASTPAAGTLVYFIVEQMQSLAVTSATAATRPTAQVG